jgi:hypothetical protein
MSTTPRKYREKKVGELDEFKGTEPGHESALSRRIRCSCQTLPWAGEADEVVFYRGWDHERKILVSDVKIALRRRHSMVTSVWLSSRFTTPST